MLDLGPHRRSEPAYARPLVAAIAAFSIASVVAPGVAFGQPARGTSRRAPEDPAAALKRQGDEAMDALRYDDAIAAYTKAYELSGMPAAVYNRGRVHQARGEYVLAMDDLERFAREATPELRARVPELDALRSELAAKIAVVTIVSNVQNARVIVRGVEVGTTPLNGALRLDGGRARIEVTAAGQQPYTQEVELPGGKESTITATLQPISDRGILVVRASTATGVVKVDGRTVGDAPVEVEVPAGTHMLTMHRDGYEDASTSAVIGVGERKEVSLRLESSPTIFQRWWFWTGVGVVVAGGAALTAALLVEKKADSGDGFEPQQVRGPLMRW
jgi:hypothetical protein